MSFFNLKSQTGFLRNLITRNTTSGEWMVIMVFAYDDLRNREIIMEGLKNEFEFITSLYYVINEKRNDTIFDQATHLYHGKPQITEMLGQLRFIIGPKSFFQTNSKQTLKLYELVKDLAKLNGSEHVYDLYTGTGTIASFIARHAGKVTGIEYINEAVKDARHNAALNELTNTAFFAGDMKDILVPQFFETHGYPDVIITDPPRAGMHPAVVQRLAASGAKRIVYVSCNPATQARDVEMLLEHYTPVTCQPVDMFPHTSHVENVMLLELK
jgi:23S rRNA (uracil1939-C5)-methyltransferase